MNSKYPVSYQPIGIFSLRGLHLIEALGWNRENLYAIQFDGADFSGKYLPNQVIATTFTRAAAAELKAVSVCVWWRFSSIWNRYVSVLKPIFIHRRSRKLIR